MTTPKLRPGDTVLIRAKVVPTTDGSTRDLHPAIQIADGFRKEHPEDLEIVEVQQAFRIGDRVYFDSNKRGTIVAISPEGFMPQQAWVEVDGEWPLRTLITKDIRRIES